MPPALFDRTQSLLLAPAFSVEASKFMEDDGPMTIDLDPKVLPEDQWLVEGVTFISTVAIAPLTDDWKPPVSGLYLCPPGTLPETQFTASFDLNLRSRPIAIPLDPYTAFRAIAVASPGSVAVGAIQMVGVPGFQISVPGGWFLRAILITSPGDSHANTGPGQESTGKLSAMVRIVKRTAYAAVA